METVKLQFTTKDNKTFETRNFVRASDRIFQLLRDVDLLFKEDSYTVEVIHNNTILDTFQLTSTNDNPIKLQGVRCVLKFQVINIDNNRYLGLPIVEIEEPRR